MKIWKAALRVAFLIMNLITSTQNQLIKQIKTLKDKEGRSLLSLFIVEGENIVKDIPSNADVKYIFVLDKKVDDFKYILDKYKDNQIYAVNDAVMLSISDTKTPAGIIAVVSKKESNFVAGQNVVILDGVSDPGNMGTIIRTCVACGVKDIFAINCVDYTSPKVVRSTMGGIFNVNVIPATYEELLDKLKGYNWLTLDMNGEDIFHLTKVKSPFGLIVGSEAHGVSKTLKENCTTILSLPMVGPIESLNAAVSLSVALYTLTFNK